MSLGDRAKRSADEGACALDRVGGFGTERPEQLLERVSTELGNPLAETTADQTLTAPSTALFSPSST